MAILRKSAVALAALFCLGVAVPVLAQDKATSDINAAQGTLKQLKALGAEIRARQTNASVEAGSTPVAAPEVRSTETATKKATGKKATGKKTTAPKKKKTP